MTAVVSAALGNPISLISLAEVLGFTLTQREDDEEKTVIYECTRSQMKSKKTIFARMQGKEDDHDHYFYFWLDFQMQKDTERCDLF